MADTQLELLVKCCSEYSGTSFSVMANPDAWRPQAQKDRLFAGNRGPTKCHCFDPRGTEDVPMLKLAGWHVAFWCFLSFWDRLVALENLQKVSK